MGGVCPWVRSDDCPVSCLVLYSVCAGVRCLLVSRCLLCVRSCVAWLCNERDERWLACAACMLAIVREAESLVTAAALGCREQCLDAPFHSVLTILSQVWVKVRVRVGVGVRVRGGSGRGVWGLGS